MIFIFLATVFSKPFNILEVDLEKHATKTKLLSLELEKSLADAQYFFPARIEFLSEKIHSELILMENKTSDF